MSTTEKKLRVSTFTDQMFGENAYVVWLRDGGPCWIIDPGLAPSPPRIIAHVEKHQLKPAALLLTHGHLDHIGGVPDIMAAFPDLPIHIALAAKPALTDPNENLSSNYGAGLVVGEYETIDLPEGGSLELDGTSWRIIDTSGHAPGSRSFSTTSATVPTFAYSFACRGSSRTVVASPVSRGRVTVMPGKTTVSSRATRRIFSMRPTISRIRGLSSRCPAIGCAARLVPDRGAGVLPAGTGPPAKPKASGRGEAEPGE